MHSGKKKKMWKTCIQANKILNYKNLKVKKYRTPSYFTIFFFRNCNVKVCE